MSENSCHCFYRNNPGSDYSLRSRVLPALFTVLFAFMLVIVPAAAGSPTVKGITPASGINETTVQVTDLNGTNFQSGATVRLTPVNFPPVHAGSIVNGTGVLSSIAPVGYSFLETMHM